MVNVRFDRVVGAGFEARCRAGGYALRNLVVTFWRLSDIMVCSRGDLLRDLLGHRATHGCR